MAARAARLPDIADLPDLPIRDVLDGLRAALAEHGRAVIAAPPGAGKTTVVPLALLGAPWRGDGRIVVLEPRRLATLAAPGQVTANAAAAAWTLSPGDVAAAARTLSPGDVAATPPKSRSPT